MSRSGRVRDKVPMFKGHSVRKEVCSEDEEIRNQLEEDELLRKEENESPWRAQEDDEGYRDPDELHCPPDFQDNEPEKSEGPIDDGERWFVQDYKYIDLDWNY